MQIGYKLATEAFGPKEIIRQAVLAEQAGFDFVELSDHYHPWLDVQGHSAFTWTLLGSIAAQTDRIGLATGVTCPMVRYHPAIIAQAAATTALVSDGRFHPRRRRRRAAQRARGRPGLPGRPHAARDAARGPGDHSPVVAGRLPLLPGQVPAARGRASGRP